MSLWARWPVPPVGPGAQKCSDTLAVLIITTPPPTCGIQWRKNHLAAFTSSLPRCEVPAATPLHPQSPAKGTSSVLELQSFYCWNPLIRHLDMAGCGNYLVVSQVTSLGLLAEMAPSAQRTCMYFTLRRERKPGEASGGTRDIKLY